MAWEIAPNSTIKLYRDVPLDETYEHTIYFENLNAQSNYFHNTLTAYKTYNETSYQRYQKGVLRVEEIPDNLFGCNYMAFRNTSFSNKWFYAFVTGVNYISNYVAEVEYTIDIMQTWFFDYTLEESFVVRQHSESDNLYENLVEENLDLGETPVVLRENDFDMNGLRVCIVTTENLATANGVPIIYQDPKYCTTGLLNNVFTPLYFGYNLKMTSEVSPSGQTWIEDVLDTIDYFVQRGWEDKIVTIFEYPAFMSEVGGQPADASQIIGHKTIRNATPDGNAGIAIDNLDGYHPKNKKLFSYPYSFMNVSNNCGTVQTYHYEDWNEYLTRGDFNIDGVFLGASPTALCSPHKHRGLEFDYDSGITYSNFPQCSWVGDVFKCYMAQNRNQIGMSVLSSVVNAIPTPTFGASEGTSAVASFANGNANSATTFNEFRGASMSADPVKSIANVGLTVGNIMAKKKDLKNYPPQVHGHTSNDTLNLGMHRVQFKFYNMSIKRQFAERIDSYFDKYGYQQNKFALPNRIARPHWTYIRTAGCTMTGIHMPSSVVSALCTIYDNGITFWRNPSEVGNYTLDNSPQGV